MYTLTEQDLKTIKDGFGTDQPSINGVSIIDLIIQLSEINSKVVATPVAKRAKTAIVDITPE